VASAVVPGVDVLLENFTSVADWTGGTITSVAGGRSGNAGQLAGSGGVVYGSAFATEDATITVGVALKVSSLAAARPFLSVASDSSVTIHDTLRVNADGSLSVLLGSTGGVPFGTTAAGLIAVGTWYYVETQIRLHDTAGTVVVRLGGATVLNLAGVDTKNSGTKAVFDGVRLVGGGSGAVHLFDDLYVTMGAGAAFKGDTTVP
jgi:hypothetical protein